jgi:hypothetical protein
MAESWVKTKLFVVLPTLSYRLLPTRDVQTAEVWKGLHEGAEGLLGIQEIVIVEA